MTSTRSAWTATVWFLALWMEVLGPAARGEEIFRPSYGDPLHEPWRWRVFPELNGLGALSIAEDGAGTLWFGAGDGLWTYDGFEWHSTPISQLRGAGGVLTLCAGPDGAMYAAGRWGISRFYGGVWTRIFPERGGGVGEVRKLVFSDDGHLWAATASGALHRSGNDWILHTTPEVEARLRNASVQAKIECWPETVLLAPSSSGASRRHDLTFVAPGAGGQMWFGTEGGEILRRDRGTVEALPGTDGAVGGWELFNENHGIVRGRRPSILPLRDGRVWVVFEAGSGHLNSFDGQKWLATSLAEAGALGDCSHPLQTRDGTVWLSGRYAICAWRDGQWTTYQKPQAPIPSAWNFMLETSDGALWIGGPSTEVLRVDYGTGRWLTLKDLIYGWEAPSGDEWFIHRDGRIVAHRKTGWTAFSPADGTIDTPVALTGTRSGEIWVVGSHQREAASSRYDGSRWHRYIHDEFSWGVAGSSLWEGFDGSIWFGAMVDSSGPPKHRAGLLQYRNGSWIHHHQPGRAFAGGDDSDPATLLPATQRPEPVGKFMYVAGLPDGRIWTGRNLLVQRSGERWSVFALPEPLRHGIIEAMLGTTDQGFWIGTRQFGALRYDGREWTRFQGKGSLVANSVRSLAQTEDGTIWAATDRGVSRFDGREWTSDLLPAQWHIPSEGGALKAGRGGKIWVNLFSPDWARRAWPKWTPVDLSKVEFETACHNASGPPPQTKIAVGPIEVDSSGNVSVLWAGSSPWRSAAAARLQFSHRLDGGSWSAFDEERGAAFFSLAPGRHRLEVRARDRDFNVDPTPAVLEFTVKPPVWRQPWFVLVTVGLTGLAALQSIRVFLERGRLRRLNESLAAEVAARKATEASLRASEADLRDAQEIARFGNWSMDTINRRLDWSAEVCRIFETGTENAATDFQASLEKVHPDDRATVKKAFDDARENGTPFDLEHRLRFPDGRIKYVNPRGRPMRDADGRIVRILGTLQDITERKQAEIHIFRLNRTYAVLSDINQLIVRAREPQSIIEGAAEIAVTKGGFGFSWIGVVDPQTGKQRVATCAGEAPGLCDVLKAKLENESATDAVAAERRVFNDLARDSSGSPGEIALARGLRSAVSLPLVVDGRFAGTFNLYAGEPEFFDTAELRLLNELAQDIGFALEACHHEEQRRRALDELRISEDRFRELAETIEDVFWIASPVRDRIYYVSPAFHAVWGRPCQALYDNPRLWTEAIHPDDRAQALQAMTATDRGSAYDVEYRIMRPDGTHRWVRDRGFSAQHPHGVEPRILGVARDITAARQLEDQFRQAQKMEAVGQLAGGVAHDFNNILAAIMLQIEITAESAVDPELKKALAEIKLCAERAANLTRQLLLFSRRQVLQTRALDLNEVVTSVSRMLQRLLGENIKLNLALAPEVLSTIADAGMLDQVLLNLTVNARDAMSEGGTITIETGGTKLSDAEARQHPGAEPGLYVWLAVTDTGCGIPPDILPRIFEPFFTTKSPGKGTGLGLATVFGIVKQHRGWLSVDSEPGKGTRFCVFLPAATSREGEGLLDFPAAHPLRGTETILLVEDDESVRASMRIILQKYGYRVLEAEHGRTACELWARHREEVALLLTDVILPDRMSGHQLAGLLRKDKPALKVVYSSGYNPEVMENGIDAGQSDAFVPKPFTAEQLLTVVRRCVTAP